MRRRRIAGGGKKTKRREEIERRGKLRGVAVFFSHYEGGRIERG